MPATPPPIAPKVAIISINLESNAFSPTAMEADFRSLCYLEGEEAMADARSGTPIVGQEPVGFIKTMDATGPWQPIPTVFAWCHPWGPVDQAFFQYILDEIVRRIDAAGGVDAVYVGNHGAMLAAGNSDPDGELLTMLRAKLGPDVPIVVSFDLHANVSARTAKAADVVIAYQTNPHVDMFERGEESAHTIRAMLAGNVTPHAAYVKLPIAPPTPALLTRAGPYADLIDYGQRRKREMGGAILNVSVVGGFVYADSASTGLSVIVTGRYALEPAERLAGEIARMAWGFHERFQCELLPFDQAVADTVTRGHDAKLPAIIYADIGDNPGGGGGGDTTDLLAALVKAQAKGVLYGSFFDQALAKEAVAAGVGAEITATFNRTPLTRFSSTYEVPAKVVAVSTEPFVGRLGLYAGQKLNAQPAAALQIGGEDGITVVVISNRYQTADPMFFEHLGFDIAKARTVVVKSRGHFRSGFEPFFPPEQVQEPDTPGFTSPILTRFDWKDLPRPVFPLDQETEWTPPNW